MYYLTPFCCVCLTQKPNLKSVNSKSSDNIEYYLKINYCCFQNDQLNDDLPLYICTNCRYNLRIAYEFKKKCVKNVELIRGYIAKFQRKSKVSNENIPFGKLSIPIQATDVSKTIKQEYEGPRKKFKSSTSDQHTHAGLNTNFNPYIKLIDIIKYPQSLSSSSQASPFSQKRFKSEIIDENTENVIENDVREQTETNQIKQETSTGSVVAMQHQLSPQNIDVPLSNIKQEIVESHSPEITNENGPEKISEFEDFPVKIKQEIIETETTDHVSEDLPQSTSINQQNCKIKQEIEDSDPEESVETHLESIDEFEPMQQSIESSVEDEISNEIKTELNYDKEKLKIIRTTDDFDVVVNLDDFSSDVEIVKDNSDLNKSKNDEVFFEILDGSIEQMKHTIVGIPKLVPLSKLTNKPRNEPMVTTPVTAASVSSTITTTAPNSVTSETFTGPMVMIQPPTVAPVVVSSIQTIHRPSNMQTPRVMMVQPGVTSSVHLTASTCNNSMVIVQQPNPRGPIVLPSTSKTNIHNAKIIGEEIISTVANNPKTAVTKSAAPVKITNKKTLILKVMDKLDANEVLQKANNKNISLVTFAKKSMDGSVTTRFTTLQDTSLNAVIPYMCKPCKFSFISVEEFEQHVKTHKNRLIKCFICPNLFKNYEDLSGHLSSHINICPLQCQKCFKHCVASELSDSAQKICNDCQTLMEAKIGLFKCSFCLQIVSRASDFNSHMIKHINDERLDCMVCIRNFMQKYLLDRYLLQHIGVRGLIYSCTICHAQVTSRLIDFNNHINGHLESKTYSCSHCSEKFKFDERELHLPHGKDKMFPCVSNKDTSTIPTTSFNQGDLNLLNSFGEIINNTSTESSENNLSALKEYDLPILVETNKQIAGQSSALNSLQEQESIVKVLDYAVLNVTKDAYLKNPFVTNKLKTAKPRKKVVKNNQSASKEVVATDVATNTKNSKVKKLKKIRKIKKRLGRPPKVPPINNKSDTQVIENPLPSNNSTPNNNAASEVIDLSAHDDDIEAEETSEANSFGCAEEEQNLSCVRCEEKFEQKSELAVHMTTVHNGEVPEYICSKCDRTFYGMAAFSSHVNKKPVERLQTLGKKKNATVKETVCVVCDETFPNTLALYAHRMTHFGRSLFKCNICSKSFVQQSNLEYHMQRHKTTEDKFMCKRCILTFPKFRTYRRHMQRCNLHLCCKKCGEKFETMVLLIKHNKEKHSNGVIKCKSCNKEFKDEIALNIHVTVDNDCSVDVH